jgi:hypothetical protein
MYVGESGVGRVLPRMGHVVVVYTHAARADAFPHEPDQEKDDG